jgi:hypothetical protein
LLDSKLRVDDNLDEAESLQGGLLVYSGWWIDSSYNGCSGTNSWGFIKNRQAVNAKTSSSYCRDFSIDIPHSCPFFLIFSLFLFLWGMPVTLYGGKG